MVVIIYYLGQSGVLGQRGEVLTYYPHPQKITTATTYICSRKNFSKNLDFFIFASKLVYVIVQALIRSVRISRAPLL